MARRGEERAPSKRSPRVQAMQKALRLLEQAVRLDALRIAMARRMPTKARAAFIARHVGRARPVRAARALMRSTRRGRPGQRDS